MRENCLVKKFLRWLNVGISSADTTTVALNTSEVFPFSRAGRKTSSTSALDGSFKRLPVLERRPLGTAPQEVVRSGFPGTVFRTISEHGVTRPGSVAVIDGTQSLTYQELAKTVTHLADNLVLRGVARGDRVGISLEPNTASICLILALHACGAAYVPLSDSQPARRLTSMAEDAGLSFLVTATLCPSVFDGLGIERLALNELCGGLDLNCGESPMFATTGFSDGERSESKPETAPEPSPQVREETLSDTAYIIFTSGSTGRPKGVEITHANLDALMHAWDRLMGTRRHTSLLLSALSFDASVAELFWPLHHGGTLVIASKTDALHGGTGLGNLIRKHDISHLQCTPTRATLLLADPCDRAALAHLKHVVIGGEALTRTLAKHLLDAGIERITNAYGPTEATVWAFTHEVTSHLPSPVVGIGNPLFGISAAIVDSAGEEISEIGAQGELVLGGPFVASGYVNREALSAERFTSRSFQDSPVPVHSYRTGDLVSRNADGTLDFHGRTDEQVKIRGHRIELGEIEAALDSHLYVQRSVVCVRERNGSGELLALVVLNRARDEQDPVEVNELRTHLKGLLPEVMIPSQIVFVPELPVNASSKIDRVRVRDEVLVALYPAARETIPEMSTTTSFQDLPGDEFQANPVAAMIWDFAEVLGLAIDSQIFLDRELQTLSEENLEHPTDGKRVTGTSAEEVSVHKHTDFFAVGGHSMFAVALLARIEARTGAALPIRELLCAPTPRQLTAVVQSHLDTPDKEFNPLVRFQLSTVNRRLYLVHGAGGNVLRYRNLAKALRDVVDTVGVQAVGVEPGNQPDRSLTAMVNRYVSALLATGDQEFEIGGYSDGGIVAIHVAQKLQAAGKSVRSLTLLDAFSPVKTTMDWRSQLANIRFSFLTRDTLPFSQWLRGAVVGWRRRAAWDSEGAQALRRLGYVDIYELNERVVRSEALPEIIAAPSLVVRTFEETPTRRRDYSVGYDPKQATVAWVCGTHDELLKPPSIPELEAAIRAFLPTV